MPAPKFIGFDNSGNIVAAGLLYTYAAGGAVTPLALRRQQVDAAVVLDEEVGGGVH